MSGLRASQKEARRNRILKVAADQFKTKGFKATTINAIAKAAKLSPATVYNYYPTKGHLLIEIVSAGDKEVIRKSQDRVQNPSKDPANALFHLLVSFNEMSLENIDRLTWRTVLADALLKGTSTIGKKMKSLNYSFYEQIVFLLQRLAQDNALQPRTDEELETIAEVLFNTNHALFIDIVTDEKATLEHYRAKLRSHVNLILREQNASQSQKN